MKILSYTEFLNEMAKIAKKNHKGFKNFKHASFTDLDPELQKKVKKKNRKKVETIEDLKDIVSDIGSFPSDKEFKYHGKQKVDDDELNIFSTEYDDSKTKKRTKHKIGILQNPKGFIKSMHFSAADDEDNGYMGLHNQELISNDEEHHDKISSFLGNVGVDKTPHQKINTRSVGSRSNVGRNIALGVGAAALLGGGLYYLRKALRSKEKKLQDLKDQWHAETDPEKKAKLREKVNKMKKQIELHNKLHKKAA